MKTVFKFFITSLILISFNAQAEFHRFYRGFSLLDEKSFLGNVNKDFFPLFQKAHPEGLIGYRPILLNEESTLGLPNEIVILSFKDEEIYKAYGASEIGKKIRAAHAPVFDAKKSNSLVPTSFTETVKPESAYLLGSEAFDYSKGASGVLIFTGPVDTAEVNLKKIEQAFVAANKQEIIALVAQGYLIEYLFAKDSKSLAKLKNERLDEYKKIFKWNKFVALEKHKIGQKRVNFGQGMDAQF